jgi:hypothetical protein
MKQASRISGIKTLIPSGRVEVYIDKGIEKANGDFIKTGEHAMFFNAGTATEANLAVANADLRNLFDEAPLDEELLQEIKRVCDHAHTPARIAAHEQKVREEAEALAEELKQSAEKLENKLGE